MLFCHSRRYTEEQQATLKEMESTTYDGKWTADILEDITAYFYEQVKTLMETVRQMESALQRRSKLRSGASATVAVVGTPNSSSALSDSEKISLQLQLDVDGYGVEIRSKLLRDPMSIESYRLLAKEVSQ